MAVKLSEGALKIIMTGGSYEAPVVQVLASKKLVSSNSSDRYRLLISDGKYLNSFAMVATQLNELVVKGDLSEFTIVKINRYITTIFNNPDKDKRVMVILELDILKKGNEVGVRIGNPVSLDEPKSHGVPRPSPVPFFSNATRSYNDSTLQPKKEEMKCPILPIASLNPYQNKWSIKARVTSKQPPRAYSNARGEGRLFSVVFADESGEIKCTGFNSAVEKHEEKFEVNKVYIVSNCIIKPANKKYTQADYELTFTDDTIIIPTADDSKIPSQTYNFVSISKIPEVEVTASVDVIGVAKTTSDAQVIFSKSLGREVTKREVILVDQSKSSVSLTLWSDEAVNFDGSKHPVVAIKNARISEFMGCRSLSVALSSIMDIDPDIPEAHQLRGWFDSGGSDESCTSVSSKAGTLSVGSTNFVLIGEMAFQGLGLGDKADYFSGVVNVLMVKSENCVYKSCPANDCKKKVMDMNNGTYRCEKCNKDYDHFSYRMLLSVQVSDFTGSIWVTLFHEEAQRLLGVEADVIGSLIDNGDESYKEYFTKMNFKKYQMKFRTKLESYNDEKRLKTTVVNVEPVDYKSYARRLLDNFKEKSGMVSKPRRI